MITRVLKRFGYVPMDAVQVVVDSYRDASVQISRVSIERAKALREITKLAKGRDKPGTLHEIAAIAQEALQLAKSQ